jgi:hypothetical protein
LHILQWLIEKFEPHLTISFRIYAFIFICCRQCPHDYYHILAGAAKEGHIEVINWGLVQNKNYWNYSNVRKIAKRGHFEVLKLAYNFHPHRKFPFFSTSPYPLLSPNLTISGFNDFVVYDAARSGREDILKWAYEHVALESQPNRVCMGCVQAGRLDMLKWVREQGCDWGTDAFYTAVKKGDIEILEYLLNNGCPWKERDLINADAKVIQWATGIVLPTFSAPPPSQYTADYAVLCIAAAKSGSLHMLQWLRENGYPWTAEVCSYAAQEGHLAVLKWARKNGCEWSKYICKYAAEYGHLEVPTPSSYSHAPLPSLSSVTSYSLLSFISSGAAVGKIEWM